MTRYCVLLLPEDRVPQAYGPYLSLTVACGVAAALRIENPDAKIDTRPMIEHPNAKRRPES